ncbi:hypothetical protein [Streptomyces sp. NPDC060194]|uniref:hypothetical protein n=1 Tax=Streptomyces sp. NPDC060194 TaxID=3347069 RepID=UPI00364AA48D
MHLGYPSGVDPADGMDALETEGPRMSENDRETPARAEPHGTHSEPAPSEGDDDLLAIYLNDHLTGATAGVDLFERAAEARKDDDHGGGTLARLSGEIEEDRDDLLRIMAGLDVPVRRSQAALGWLAEKAGRLKPNGHLLTRSPLSDVLEAEAMLLGVQGKAACWRTLRALSATDPRLDTARLDRLLDRAERQTAALEEIRAEVSARTFVNSAAE